jgi:hypothetical protein
VKFNKDEKRNNIVGTDSDYSLTYKPNRLSTLIFSHKDNGLTSLDANIGLFENDTNLFTLYTLNKFTQTGSRREFVNKVHVRAHHGDNKILSLGVEDWDPISKPAPDVVSATGVYGFRLADYKAFATFNLGYRISGKSLAFHKWAGVVRANNFNAILELGFNQKAREIKNATTGTITKENYVSKEANLLVDADVLPDLRVGADARLNLDDSNIKLAVVGDYRIDSTTTFRAKIDNENTAVLSLNHNYRGLINFGIVSSVRLFKFNFYS